ncbi:MAG: antibiotic resistance protein MarC [Calditrichaeota bacterium]|nr:MAG: antibiotic resistance protein MarC [Calditrichota bacterium]
MNELITFSLLSFTSFFTLINPLGVMPVYMTMTSGLTTKERTKTARKAVITSFFILLAFAFSGQLLFDFFGISVDSFRIAGGIIFFMVGQDMLHARLTTVKVREDEIHKYVNDISITPLAIPMLAGPGSITNAIVLMEDAGTFELKMVLIGTLISVLVITFIILWGAAKISKFLGETGNNILMRIMGLIVMVIAVEFFFSGLGPILRKIFITN